MDPQEAIRPPDRGVRRNKKTTEGEIVMGILRVISLEDINKVADWWWSASDHDKFVAFFGEPVQFDDGSYTGYYHEKMEVIRRGFFSAWGCVDMSRKQHVLGVISGI